MHLENTLSGKKNLLVKVRNLLYFRQTSNTDLCEIATRQSGIRTSLWAVSRTKTEIQQQNSKLELQVLSNHSPHLFHETCCTISFSCKHFMSQEHISFPAVETFCKPLQYTPTQNLNSCFIGYRKRKSFCTPLQFSENTNVNLQSLLLTDLPS